MKLRGRFMLSVVASFSLCRSSSVRPRLIDCFVSSRLQGRQQRFLASKKKKKKKGGGGGKQRGPYERFKYLHPAAKMKRVLSFSDYYFSVDGLRENGRIRNEVLNREGWCRLNILLLMPKFQGWAKQNIVLDAYAQAERFSVKKEVSTKEGVKPKYLVKRRHLEENLVEALTPPEKMKEKGDELEEEFAEELISELAEEPNDIKRLPKYSTDREIVVLRTQKQLKKLANVCERLSQSPAIGLDVEYATLELNISSTLPAVLQLAGDDLVVILWLHKYDNHGKDMLLDPVCEPLLRLLQSSDVAKVGVGSSKDIRNLARWWKVTDREEIGYHFSNILDIEDISDTGSPESLQELCARVLKRFLLKKKQKHKKDKKHWRSPDLDERMITYAAQDASCSLDIYKALKEEEEEENSGGDLEQSTEFSYSYPSSY